MDYCKKYQKYKAKYLQFAGNRSIQDLLENKSQKDIIDGLPKLLSETKYCSKFLGRGMMGTVSISNIGPTMEITSGNKKLNLNVVVKNSNKNDQDSIFEMKQIGDELLIYSFMNLNTEAILLSVMSNLWHKKVSPHLPLMVGYSMCDNKKNVTTIITEKHGLPYEINYDEKDGFFKGPMWRKNKVLEPTFLATLGDLLDYIKLKRQGEEVILPNEQKCNIVELLDYLVISYIHTDNILQKHNIVLTDMHSYNIFIHWLNDNSYLGDTPIGGTEYVYYKYGNKYIKAKTFGICLKLGDVGASIYKPQDKVYVLGQCGTENKCLDIAKQYISFKNHEIFNIIKMFLIEMPLSIIKKTVISIMNDTYPYSEMAFSKIENYELLSKLKSNDELLGLFDKYIVSDLPKDRKNILIV